MSRDRLQCKLADICDYCGKPPPVLDTDGLRLAPFTGWACIVCAAEIGPFDE